MQASQYVAKAFILRHIFLLTILFPFITGVSVMAQQFAGDMEKVVVKLTYLGIQDKPIPSLLLSAREISEPTEMLRQHELLHANDEYGMINIVIAPWRLQKVVDLVGRNAGRVAGEPASPVLSVALIVTGQQVLQDFQLSDADAATFFNDLRQKLSGDEQAVTQFDGWRVRTNL